MSVVKGRQEPLAIFEDKLNEIQERTRTRTQTALSEGQWVLSAGIIVLEAALHDYMDKDEAVSFYRKLADVSEQWLKRVKAIGL
jgi:hypothetical protein